jgi:hypothetical protein
VYEPYEPREFFFDPALGNFNQSINVQFTCYHAVQLMYSATFASHPVIPVHTIWQPYGIERHYDLYYLVFPPILLTINCYLELSLTINCYLELKVTPLYNWRIPSEYNW